ncbi:ADP-ribosylglycohydrolase family protein [Actinocorallia longicatena]|uniref:ADP-ribosylglycohydrolase n=1 Tax=Actinocorallia longicatena TaxID=111803 RepID=A0ABP6QBQ7_9ACTN
MRERIRGCLLGGAIGDALGAPIEFQSLAEIRRIHGENGVESFVWHDSGRLGVVTDDTQMTLFTVEGILRAAGDVPASVFAAHRRWYATQILPFPSRGRIDLPVGDVLLDGGLGDEAWLYARRAPGNACLSGLRSGRRATLDEPANPDSKGCGAVMRSAPFGLVPAWTPGEAFALASECGAQTHGHPSGHLAAGALAALTRLLLDGLTLEEAVNVALGLLATRPGHEETAGALRRALEAPRDKPSAELLETLGAGWIAEEALAMSVYCALAHPGSVRDALLLAVNHSGDSDSTGAITGNLLGTALGESALPRAWADAVEGAATTVRLADELAALEA